MSVEHVYFRSGDVRCAADLYLPEDRPAAGVVMGHSVHMVKEVDHYRNDYKRLFVLKPGATGLTQIIQATENPEISWEEEIRLDEFYIENWSIWLDLKIILLTIPALWRDEGAS